MDIFCSEKGHALYPLEIQRVGNKGELYVYPCKECNQRYVKKIGSLSDRIEARILEVQRHVGTMKRRGKMAIPKSILSIGSESEYHLVSMQEMKKLGELVATLLAQL